MPESTDANKWGCERIVFRKPHLKFNVTVVSLQVTSKIAVESEELNFPVVEIFPDMRKVLQNLSSTFLHPLRQEKL